MKSSVRHRPSLALCVIGLSAFSAGAAQASSAFNADATLTYTINSITNLDHPGDLSQLEILGSFIQSVASADLTGDGTVVDNNLDIGPSAIAGSVFAHTFAVSGNVSDGTILSHHLGQFDVSFRNNGQDHYSIGLTLAYQLNANTNGEYADSDVSLDYFNADDTFSGFDAINASVLAQPQNSTSGSSALYGFTLDPSASQALTAYVAINSHMEATPVPVPAALWMFAPSLLGLFGIAKRKPA